MNVYCIGFDRTLGVQTFEIRLQWLVDGVTKYGIYAAFIWGKFIYIRKLPFASDTLTTLNIG